MLREGAVDAKCAKCGADHKIDATGIGWTALCERCRRPWGMKQRGWMREKHKAMVKKRNRALRGAPP
jgi:hypothetical protein